MMAIKFDRVLPLPLLLLLLLATASNGRKKKADDSSRMVSMPVLNLP